MNDTTELLRAWVEQSSEDAFAQLVSRHINLVYSVAVRKVGGNTGLATEITQSVFVDLARKARSLRAEGSLAGWLHRHTCFLAATALRSELRRQAREQTAAAMHAIENTSHSDWSSVSPLLDDAVNALGDVDRRAILLRFYEQRDIHSVGRVLGLNDDAAQKRIGRALEKLRGWLARRGVKSTSLALATLLTTQSVTAAPPGIAIAITSAALSGVAAAGAGTGLVVNLINFMTHAKTNLALTAALAACVAGPIVWQENAIARTRQDNRDLADRILLLEPSQTDAIATEPTPALDQSTNAVQERVELDRLRREVVQYQEQLQSARTTRLANAAAMAAAAKTRTQASSTNQPSDFLAAMDAQDVGTATGADLFQTMTWAMRMGDTNRLLDIGDWSSEDGQAGIADLVRRFQHRQGAAAQREVRQIVFRTLEIVPLENGDGALIVEAARSGGGEGSSQGQGTRQAFRVRQVGLEWRFVMGRHGPQLVPLSPEVLGN